MTRRKDPGPLPQARRVTVPGAKGARHPGFVEPQLATLRDRPPPGDRYIHEIKFDGYRLQVHLRGGLPSLWTRGGLDWTKRFPPIAVAASRIPATDLIIDGEVISANEKGAANFSHLQDDLSKSRYDRMVYYAFDLLYLDGYDLRAAPLIERKRALSELLKRAGDIGPFLFSQHFEDGADAMFAKSCELGLEGIVSKLRDAPYKSERSQTWLKVKCVQTARYEVIGYKEGATSLYLGRREGKDLMYVGKAGTGFTNTMILELHRLLMPITVPKMPLAKKPDRKNKIDHWAAPKYWAEVEYRDITTDGLLRHTTFKGLYASKSAKKALVAKFKGAV
jgi:bifunctional non-homologous end joining protein LigD